ncbi:DUF3489 domain-containing protein [Sphingomonas endolithica]|uniref:DUF3489 domain-containing protein n=1 Tax=Sphingomonas endolithica TaxID=2972485 RepID=UPI0021B01A39|nr:DUF3489 domain-containing protein [Sphingomonas sp. ZFBP2030]
MTKLTDLDAILLSGAAKRDSGSLLPVPESVSGAGARMTKAITGLIKHGLAEERETRDKIAVRRTEADIAYGVFITDAGNAAIGIAGGDAAIGIAGGDGSNDGGEAEVTGPTQPDTPRVTKASSVLALLRREEGATLADMIEATGWLPHTTRAALTGLRKKGHTLEKSKRGDQTCYRIAAVAA